MWVVKQIVLHLYHGILLRNKRHKLLICATTCLSVLSQSEKKKLITTGYTHHTILCVENSFFLFFIFIFLLFRATPVAYGGSQARGPIRATTANIWPTPQPQQHQIWTASANQAASVAHGNARSLAHWARPGIEPATSWFLAGFIFTAPRKEIPEAFLKQKNYRMEKRFAASLRVKGWGQKECKCG